jgi:hypothetical protein
MCLAKSQVSFREKCSSDSASPKREWDFNGPIIGLRTNRRA